MTHKPSSNLLGFMAVAAGLVAWKAAPVAGASDVVKVYGHLGSGMAALVCTVMAVQSIQANVGRPSPWPSLFGRIAWALRPRSFMIAWAVIIGATWIIGTPHLAIEYPPRPCTYFGLSGTFRMPPGSACPWWRWL
jgi:hypothetical protein